VREKLLTYDNERIKMIHAAVPVYINKIQ